MTTLKWNDLTSPTLTINQYLEKYKAKENLIQNYKTYKPKNAIIDQIISFLNVKDESLRILALGADWCKDCSLNVPQMIKIVEEIQKRARIDLRILYGIMVDALHKKGEVIWHKKRSPPEAIDPKFSLKAIPTFYLFKSEGSFIGNIIEGPDKHPTLEEELLSLLKNNL